jgi:hypothetical protein
MRLWRVVPVVFSCVFTAGAVSANTWYVAPGGSDVNAGTVTAPFATITKAAAVAQPNDDISVRGGTYNQRPSISSRGTSAAWISIHAYPGELPIIDGTGLGIDKNLVSFVSASYVLFSGFEVRNATRIGIMGWNSNNIKVANNTVHDSVRNGIYFGSDAMGIVSDIVVDGNTVYNNVTENQFHTMNGGWASGVMISWCNRGQIINNNVYQNNGEGIIYLLSNQGLVQQNQVHDNFSVGIYLDNARTTLVNRNFAYSTGDTRFYRTGHPAAGIGTANEAYSASNPLSDLTITNNIVVNSHWGFYYGAYGIGGGLKNTLVANNTFYKSTGALLWIENGPHANSTIENNIFDQVGGVMTDVTGAGVSYHNNHWYGGNAGAATGIGDIIGDPGLANAGGLNAADYKLTALSPGLHLGATVSSVTADYWGSTRGAINDIGAHQLSDLTTPPAPTADTTAPSTPTGLASSVNGNSITLRWTASTDNVGVTGYRVYRNGALAANVGATSWTDTGLAISTTYSYAVSAVDAAGNESAQSVALSVRTGKKRAQSH